MIKKLKQLYKENRVFTILMCISVTCLLLVVILFGYYLISSTSKSKYGTRLDGINDVKIDNENKLENSIQKMDGVDEATVNVHGKIVYLDIKVNDDTSMDSVKAIADESLKLFEDDYLNYYDFHFMVTKDNEEQKEFPALGYRKSGAKKVTWSHNTGA